MSDSARYTINLVAYVEGPADGEWDDVANACVEALAGESFELVAGTFDVDWVELSAPND